MCNHKDTRIRFHSTFVIDTANFITSRSAGANGLISRKIEFILTNVLK